MGAPELRGACRVPEQRFVSFWKAAGLDAGDQLGAAQREANLQAPRRQKMLISFHQAALEREACQPAGGKMERKSCRLESWQLQPLQITICALNIALLNTSVVNVTTVYDTYV